ncbi:MAG TPA: hypothetical protein VKE51_31010 [Vicinamibacterales bacterium]|nr:hypothetical protein [Vicinamibacterales bacterium]
MASISTGPRRRRYRSVATVISIVCGIAAAMYVSAVGRAQTAPPSEVSTLLQIAHFSPEDIATVTSGGVAVRSEASTEDLEAVVVAAVQVRAALDRTLSYFRQLVSFEDGEVTLRFGLFGKPPRPDDLARAALDDDTVDDLKSCRPGDCGVRIGTKNAAEIGQAIDWRAADAAERAAGWARQALAAYAADYLARGDAALVTYDDQSKPVSLKDTWRAIVDRSPALAQYAPALQRHLTGFPAVALPGATDEIYWIQEHYTTLKTVTGVTHLVTWHDPEHPDRAVVAQKQIYASRYYYGSLAVTLFLQDSRDAAQQVTWLVYFNRSRGDLLKGGFGGLRRRLAESMIKDSADAMLGAIKRELEK